MQQRTLGKGQGALEVSAVALGCIFTRRSVAANVVVLDLVIPVS
jgi:hypothetical protein